MFTGIIEGLGTITHIQGTPNGKRFSIAADFSLSETRVGDSIAVNGACLTAVTLEGRRFSADVSPETLVKTNFGKIRVGDRVNLERALRLSDRIDGHLVSGHIDGTAVIAGKEPQGNAVKVVFELGESLTSHMIDKGSVAIDGISLTINHVDNNSFDVMIIPHTGEITTISFKKPGDVVNIETDMIGKYIEKFVKGLKNEKESIGSPGIDRAFLMKNGFL